MRLLLITQLFDPESTIKGLSLCKRLVALGFEVEVITSFPNYPGGRLYPGYRMRLLQRERVDGVTIVRLPMYVTHDRSPLKRLLGYGTFSLVAFFYALARAKRPDVIYSYYPPVVGGVMAATLGAVLRRPFVYDVQDLWPEAVVATGMARNGRVIKIIESLARWIYSRAAAVVVLSEGYKRALLAKGVPERKLIRVYNWCDEGRLTPAMEDDSGRRSTFDIVYAGNMGAAQALQSVIDAARLLQERGRDDIRFVLIGTGVEKEALERRAMVLGLCNVVFRPRIPPEEVGVELARADALLVHLAADPVFTITVPSKTQAYLAAGRPILMAVSGESADIISQAGAGVVARCCDPVDIARAAVELADAGPATLVELGRAGQRYYMENMSEANGVRALSELLRSVASSQAT